MPTVTLTALNATDREAFVSLLGEVFEHSPWVAEGAFDARPFASVAALHQAMTRVVAEAGEGRQLELIRAHPDLADRAALAGKLTQSSTREQRGAGLDALSADEYARFHNLNNRYRDRFAFPFVLAVKGHTKTSILEAFETRLGNDPERERERALAEIARIARFRLAALVDEG